MAEIDRLRARVATLEAADPPSTSTHLVDPHLILEHINDSVVVVDAELRILRWNRASEWLYGWPAAEVLGRRTLDVVPLRYPDDTARLAAVKALRETRYWRGEALATRRDGTEIVVEGSSQMLYDDQGSMIGIINISRDVTERSRAATERERLIARERMARQQAEVVQTRLSILARASQIFADASLDLQAVLSQVTEHMAAVLGDACAIRLLSADERALELRHFFHANPAARAVLHTILFSTPLSVDDGPHAQVLRTRQTLALALAPAREQLPPQILEYIDQFGAHSALIVPLSVRGRAIGTLAVVRDETPQAFTDDDRIMIQELSDRAATAIDNARLYATAQTVSREQRETLALLDTLFATAPIGLAFFDHDLRYVRINENLADMNGLPVADHLGRTISDVLPEFAATVEPLYRQVLTTGEAVGGVEIRAGTRDRPGVPRDWLASYYPVRGPDATIIGVGTVVLDVTERKQTEEALHDYTRQLQALSRRLVEVQEAERRHLARELHDEIGQMLTGLNLLLEPGSARSGTEIMGRMAEAQALVNELTGHVRQLSLDLRPSMLDDFGLLATLRWHVDRYTAHTQVAVDFKHVGLDQPLPPHVAVTAYRIVQEALTNVARYARVTTVSLRAWRRKHTLSLEIEDQGCGFDSDTALSAGRSNGIAGMRERVLLLGGEIQIDSAPGAGTRVLVDLPLAESGLFEEPS